MHISPSKGLHEFSADTWKRFAAHREKTDKVSLSTIAAHFRLLSLIYGFAMTQGIQDWSPLGAVKIKPGRPKRAYFLSEDAVYDLVDRIEGESASPHAATDAALVAFLYFTGLRRSEVNRIELSDVDLAQGKIWIDGKRRDEFIGISESCSEFVETLVAASRDYVPDGRARGVANRGGKFLMWNISQITKAFDRIKKFDELIHPHALRHSYCTEIVKAMKAAGKSDQEILQITRIKSLQTLAIYVHLTADRSDVNLIGRGRRRKLRRVE
jgi:integrase